MNWKNRLTNYNFWVSIVSAVLLIFQAFNIKFDIMYINEIATAVLGLLVVIGIISDPTKIAVKTSSKDLKIKEDEKQNVIVETETKQEEKLEAEEKVQERVEETSEEVAEEIMPVDEALENDNVFAQDDFKILIEKISADLHKLTQQNKQPEKVEEKQEIQPKKEDALQNIEQTQETQIYNIVN